MTTRLRMSERFQFRSKMPDSAEVVYRFHAEPDALERLTPPWEKAQVIARTGSIEQRGSRTTLRVSVGPFSQYWVSEHTACEPGEMFGMYWSLGRSGGGSTRTNSSLKVQAQAGWKIALNMNFRWAGWESCSAAGTHGDGCNECSSGGTEPLQKS